MTMANSTYYNDTYYGSLMFKGIGQIIISPIGFFLNILCVIVIAKHKRFQTIPNIFVFLMSLNEAVIFIAILPVDSLHMLFGGGLIKNCAPFNYIMLLLYGTNLMIYACIAINRYVLIIHNKVYPKVFNKTGCAVMISISFLVPGLTLLQPVLGLGVSFGFNDPKKWECEFVKESGKSTGFWEITVILSFALPLLIMLFCYTGIYWMLRKQRITIENHYTSENISRYKRNDVQFTKVMAILFLMYCVLYGPYMIVSNVGLRQVHYLYQITMYLNKWNGILNSVLYIYMNKQVKKAILSLVGLK